MALPKQQKYGKKDIRTFDLFSHDCFVNKGEIICTKSLSRLFVVFIAFLMVLCLTVCTINYGISLVEGEI